MPDNIAVKPSTDVTAVAVATELIGGEHLQRVKLALGADGVDGGDVSSANPVPTALTSAQLATLTPPAAISGFATAAAQTTGNTTLASILAALGGALTIGGIVEVANDSGNPLPVSGTLGVASQAYRAQVAVTRPADTTAYTAGDVVGGAITFPAMGPSAGHIMLTSVDLRVDVAAIPSGMTSFRLYLYNATPPSALADNAAWDLPAGDRANYIGYLDLGAPADLGSTLFAQVDGVNKQCKLGASETALYGYLVTAGAYTPTASAVYNQCLRSVAI